MVGCVGDRPREGIEAMNPGESGTTVLGRTAKFRGGLTGPGNMVMEGDFEGVIRNPGATVTVGQQARVRAAIAARRMSLSTAP